MNFLFVGIGGIIGSLLRYFVSLFSLHVNATFPVGTLIVNLFGCFVLGWLTKAVAEKKRWPEHLILGVNTGIIGSFTTFSTFSTEMVRLLLNQHYILACFYMLISSVGGLFLAKVGYQLAGNVSSGQERGESNA